MGRLLVAVAGAVIGSFFGAPQLGFLAGNLLGSVLFPEKGPDGPRLENLDVTSSAFGQMIPIGFGTVRVNGNIIMGDKLKEVKREGGKGMGGAEGTTYEYYWSGLVSFGEGPASEVLRIWADTKVVYDKRPDTGRQKQKKASMNFRVLLGGETQMPDRYIIATLGDETLAPAYRGQVCIVFDNIPVKDYGNRVPSWNAEIAWDADGELTETPTSFISGPLSGTVSNNAVAVDWDRNRFFVSKQTDPNGIRQFSLTTMTETRQEEVNLGNSAFGIDSRGFIYSNDDGGNCKPIIKINGDGLVTVDTFGVTDASPIHNTVDRFVAGGDFVCIQPIVPLYGIQDFLLCSSLFNDVGLLLCQRTELDTTMEYVWGASSIIPISGKQVDEDRVRICAGPPSEGSAYGYMMGRGQFGPAEATPISFYELEVKANAQVGTNPDTGENLTMIFFRNQGSIVPSDIDTKWDVFIDAEGFVADHTDDTIMVGIGGRQEGGDDEYYFIKYDVHNSVIKWKIQVDNIPNFEAGINQSRVRNGRYAYIVGSTIYIFDTIEGTMTTEAIVGITEGGFQSYDGERDAILVRTSNPNNSVSLILLGRSSAAARGLGAIVEDICGRVGLDPTDIDVTELTDDVRGYLINQQTTGRGAIEPLAFGFLFDGCESDWVFKFKKRGQATSDTIPQEDLVVLDRKTGEYFRETRGQEMELPVAVSINFLNKETDYQPAVARQKRIAKPTPTMFSKNESTTTLPIVFTQTEAKRLADIVLYQTWVERVTVDTQLSWEYLLLDPMDSVDIDLDDGTTFHLRIVQNDAGVNMTVDMKGATEKSTGYTSDVPGDGGNFPQPEPPGSNETQMFLVDSPLLRDQDDTGGAYSILFYAFGGYGQTGWSGASIHKSADGTGFSQVGASADEVSWGTAVNALPDAEPFLTDEINTLTVVMTTGADQLVSVTDEEMMNGSNRAWLTSQNGEVEIIGFRDVTDNGDGSYTLSGILRGDRGTDTMMANHNAGDSFILLTSATVGGLPMTLTELNIDRFFRGVPFGELIQDGIRKTMQATGRDLKPYAPISVAAATVASDIEISWERRSRLAGELVDGTDSPILGEQTEAYEVDVYSDDTFTTILRTLESTTDSVTYLAADIATDFGTPPATLSLAVYQMSAAVGRGFTRQVTVDVEP